MTADEWLPVAGTRLLPLGVPDPNCTPVPGTESPVVRALPG